MYKKNLNPYIENWIHILEPPMIPIRPDFSQKESQKLWEGGMKSEFKRKK